MLGVNRRPVEVTVDLYPGAACARARAIAFISPDWQCISNGLPPSDRRAVLCVHFLTTNGSFGRYCCVYFYCFAQVPATPQRRRA